MASWMTAPAVLIGGALTAATTAVMVDIALGERPTHLVVLVLVACVVAASSRRLARGVIPAARTVAAVVAAQPVLHLGVKVLHEDVGPRPDVHRMLNPLVHEAATATLQTVVPVFVIVAVVLVVRLAWLMANAVTRPVAVSALPGPAGPVSLRLGLVALGSMVHWCGWAIVAGRRGPPPTIAHATS